MSTYRMTLQQMKDVTRMLEGLNAFDNPDDDSRDVEGIEWGGGLRAVMATKCIPVTSDYYEDPEPIGWLVRGDFGWSFTQEPQP